ncbi:MAG: hypothetical protein IJE68_05740 [Clostridia bacterium]|nr:hypothetical protein [Clostridia bacterium]
MLEKFLNKNVLICIANYASAVEEMPRPGKNAFVAVQRKGTVTRVDDKFIELDNNEVVAIKYISTIKSL